MLEFLSERAWLYLSNLRVCGCPSFILPDFSSSYLSRSKMRSKLKLILRVGVPFFAWIRIRNYSEFEDDAIMVEKGLSIFIDFITHVEHELLFKEGTLRGREVMDFFNQSLIEHHMEEMEYKKR
jgi:hypothetical protein